MVRERKQLWKQGNSVGGNKKTGTGKGNGTVDRKSAKQNAGIWKVVREGRQRLRQGNRAGGHTETEWWPACPRQEHASKRCEDHPGISSRASGLGRASVPSLTRHPEYAVSGHPSQLGQGIRDVVSTTGHPSHARPGIWVPLSSPPGIQAVFDWASRLPRSGNRASGRCVTGHSPRRPARAVIPHGTPTALFRSTFPITRTTPGPTVGSLGA